MRSVVFGYGEMGRAGLRVLLDLGFDVPLVVTHVDDPRETRWFRSLADLARERGIPVLALEDRAALREEGLRRRIADLRPEAVWSFYFRWLIPEPLLASASRHALNLHGSFLPRDRGRCPVNWVLVHGETETGVTLHHMTRRADAGDIVGRRRVPVLPRDTAVTLFCRMLPEADALLREMAPRLAAGDAPREPQDEAAATVNGGRRPEDGRIDWARSAVEIDRLVRAVAPPFPGAFSTWNGKRFFIWDAEPLTRPAGGPGIVDRDPAGLVVGTGRGGLRVRAWGWEGGGGRPGPGVRLGSQG